MDLYIIRHAWAGHYGDPEWPNDAERPLTPEGRERFALTAEKLVQRGLAPEVIATSPMVRCSQTAQIIARHAPDEPDVIDLEELLPGGDLDGLLKWTAEQSEQYRRVAWVGHAPDVGRLAAWLIGDGVGWIRFAKGAAAAIRFPGHPEPRQGELRWLVTAKLLGC